VTLADGDAASQALRAAFFSARRYAERGNSARKRVKTVRNEDKSGVLRRFILENFSGVERLETGGGVLDVAGGNAELSWQLVNLNNVRATVCDPRPPSPNHLRRLIPSRGV
jgi:hypothetical protein